MTDSIFNKSQPSVPSPFGTPRGSSAGNTITRSAAVIGVALTVTPKPNPVSIPATPTLAPKFAEVTTDTLIRQLMGLPSEIGQWQADYDATDRAYKAYLAEVTIRAFSAPLFPGKKDGEPNRPASNDTEREAAIAQLVGTDPKLITLAVERESALRMLVQVKNQFEAVKLAAQLMAATIK